VAAPVPGAVPRPSVPGAVPRPAGAMPGPPAPWEGLPPRRRSGISVDEVERALAGLAGAGRPSPPPRDVALAELPPRAGSRPAAVVCLLFDRDGEAQVVLTRRSATLRSHSGEICFPGGRLGPGEAPAAAALREAQEEIGVPPEAVRLIGRLSALTTRRSPALVHCFVAAFAGPGPAGVELRPRAGEVDEIFWATLSDLAAPGTYHEELWPAGEQEAGTGVGGERAGYRAVPFFELAGATVWGATGRMLSELLSIVLRARSAGGRTEGTLVPS
jgi:8-oxo-dGTP pyrophosphatase MutT (NUDIX family)